MSFKTIARDSERVGDRHHRIDCSTGQMKKLLISRSLTVSIFTPSYHGIARVYSLIEVTERKLIEFERFDLEVEPGGLACINHLPLIVIELLDFKIAVQHSGAGEGLVVFAHVAAIMIHRGASAIREYHDDLRRFSCEDALIQHAGEINAVCFISASSMQVVYDGIALPLVLLVLSCW